MSSDDLTPGGFANGDFSSDDDYDGLDPAEMESMRVQLRWSTPSFRPVWAKECLSPGWSPHAALLNYWEMSTAHIPSFTSQERTERQPQHA